MAECSQPEEENAIAYLNNYAGKYGKKHPEYKEKDTRGEPHKRTFTLTCEFVDLEVCCEGKSKKEAKRACAVGMVKKMREAGLLSADSMEYEPVAVLQQLLQKKGYPLPKYDEVGASGLPHCKTFSIRATALNSDYKEICEPSVATAGSKKEAKKKAADELLNKVRPLLDTSSVVKHSASYTSTSNNISSMLNNINNSDSTATDRSLHQTSPSLTSSMASVNTRHAESANSLNTSMASLNIDNETCDTTDNGPVELPNDIDVVFVDGDDKLCLATISHAGEKITGCGRGNSEESARQSAIKNLTSNFRILYTPF